MSYNGAAEICFKVKLLWFTMSFDCYIAKIAEIVTYSICVIYITA